MPIEQTLSRLTEFLASDATGWVTFRHALVRDVAYAGLPYRTRQRLHGQVADSMLANADDEESDAALLSLHFFHAQRYEETWRYARVAADAAHDVYANVEAAKLYGRALEAARNCGDASDDERAIVLEALGDVQDRGGMYAESRAAYAATRKLLAGDATATGRVLLKEAFVAERRGRYAEAVRAIHRAERILDGVVSPDADRLRAQLLVWLAAIRANQGLMARAIVAAARRVARAEIAGDDEARARGLLVLDFAEEASGRAPDWQRTTDALEIYTRLGDLGGEATASNLLGAAAYYEGRWGDALEWYTRARVARAKHGDPVNVALADSNIAEILADQGRLAEADELLADAVMTWGAADDPWGVAVAQRRPRDHRRPFRTLRRCRNPARDRPGHARPHRCQARRRRDRPRDRRPVRAA